MTIPQPQSAFGLGLLVSAALLACGNGSGGKGGGATGADGGPDGTVAPPPPGADGGNGVDANGATPDGAVPTPVDASSFDAGLSVIQHHNHANRDGVFLEPAFTKSSVASLHITQHWAVNGPTYAAPLFADSAIGGKDVVIVATEQNIVYAFDANSSATIWQTPVLGPPVSLAALKSDPTVGCGNIDPLGITSTPYLDLPNRTLYVEAMTTPDGGKTKKHKVFALSLDDGKVRTGWPVDLDTALASAGFLSPVHNQRGALLLQNGVLYFPFAGHDGDCGKYHGWVVGLDVTTQVATAWKTPAGKGGIWGVAGVSSDGTDLYVTTGNTSGAGSDAAGWQGGDGVLRFSPGPVFSGTATDFFAPSNWPSLDAQDLDLGGSAAIALDVPGATPSHLMVALGKDGKVYLLDHANLGGVGGQISETLVSSGELSGASSVYTTPSGTFVAFKINGKTLLTCPNGTKGNVAAVAITLGDAGGPPVAVPAWCSSLTLLSPPSVSVSSALGTDAIAWTMSQAGGLYGYDGVTGAVVFGGGDAGTSPMGGVQYFETPIITKGHVYVAATNALYAWGL